MRVKENIGKRYGLLTIISNVGDGRGNYNVRCDCGTEKKVNLYQMKTGKTKSCGCLRKIITSERHKRGEIKYGKPALTHGMTGTKIFGLWANMLSSIRNKKYIKYQYIGGKGISCDERWFNFQGFYDDVKEKYDIAVKEIGESVSLCRIDTDKDYVLENIFFGTKTDGMKQGKRENIIWDGKRYTVYDLKRELGISFYVAKRIISEGWTREQFEEYLFKRVKKFEYNGEWFTAKEIINKFGFKNIKHRTIYNRIIKLGMTNKEAIFDGHIEGISLQETEVYNYVKGIFPKETIQSYTGGFGKGYEIDIFIEGLNVGFEFNGMHWHNSEHKIKEFHYNKSKKWFDKGIFVYHIWQNDWIEKRQIVENFIKNKIYDKQEIYNCDVTFGQIGIDKFLEFIKNNGCLIDVSRADNFVSIKYMGDMVGVLGLQENEIVCLIEKIGFSIKKCVADLLKYVGKMRYYTIVNYDYYGHINIFDDVGFHKEGDINFSISGYDNNYVECYNSGIQKYVLPTGNLAKNHYI